MLNVTVNGISAHVSETGEGEPLVLCGEGTTAPERRMCEIIAGATPRATLGVLPTAGHMSPITHPKDVANRMVRHISTHRGAN